MDSTNSGSMQSSSSGDNDECDSRGESISSFLNLPPLHPRLQPAATATTLQHDHPSSSSIFDPLSPYLASFPLPPPEFDSTWPAGIPPSSMSSYSTCTTTDGIRSSASASPSPLQPPPVLQADRSAAAPRGSKKRSRASRRAPTTVLTTDTSNFRAMVQQFTGFPTPPFAASPFPRPRLDLLNLGAAVPSYLLRPSAQKFPSSSIPPMSSSSASTLLFDHAIASIARSTLANINVPINTSATSSSSSATPSSTSRRELPVFDDFISQHLLQSQTTPEYGSLSFASSVARAQGPSGYAMGGLGSLMATEGLKVSSGTNVSSWVDELGQENAEDDRSKGIMRNYGDQR
ncbi:unnamed protein product [Musa hybrid cultivar]